jgi:uncharacterized protein (DUF302 family)
MTEYGYAVEVPTGYDEAVIRARLAFRGEGFSILSEMHVGGTLGAEAGEERQYLIMGVWNAAVENRALDPKGDVHVAVHLPCNLVIQEAGDTAMIAAFDPGEGAEKTDVPAETAEAAREALGRVLTRVGEKS